MIAVESICHPGRASRSSHFAALALAALLCPGSSRAEEGSISYITYGSWSSVTATSVSADGSVVVGLGQTIGAPHQGPGAWRWTAATGTQGIPGVYDMHSLYANAVSADGSVVVGYSYNGVQTYPSYAFRWTEAGGTQSLGLLDGQFSTYAYGVSSDGAVVVGDAYDGRASAWLAVRWTEQGGFERLGMLNGGKNSYARAVSADGSVIVGWAGDGAAGDASRAFRWTQAGGLQSLGVLNGGTSSSAVAISADGSVIVGTAADGAAANASRAFRWTAAGGMQSLGVLNGGNTSMAKAVSGDGKVIVGSVDSLDGLHSFRWTEAGGMRTIEDWFRANGINLAADQRPVITATNYDGSVVVGIIDRSAFLARVSPNRDGTSTDGGGSSGGEPPGDGGSSTGGGTPPGNGLITLDDLAQSLEATRIAGNMALRMAGQIVNGAHSRPLDRRVSPGQKAFWIAGDWGRDDYGSRNGPFGLAEIGGGYRFGAQQINVALGQTWAKQTMSMDGRVHAEGNYALVEILQPLRADGSLWATLGTHYHRGQADIRRGYINAGLPDDSRGRPATQTWGLRARVDWEMGTHPEQWSFSPYADLAYSHSRLESYTETGGGFPARFNSRQESATELRLGINASYPLNVGRSRLLGGLEAVHRFEKHGARTAGQVIGLFPFDLDGEAYLRNWLRLGLGVETRLGDGVATLMLNANSHGDMPGPWLAAAYRLAF